MGMKKTNTLLTMMLLAMILWPLLDSSCPLIVFLPNFLQVLLAGFHAREVPQEKKTLSSDLECLAPVTTTYGHLNEENLLKLIREHPFSAVLVKGFLTSDQTTDLLHKFQATTGDNKYSMINGSHEPHQRMGSLFSKGVAGGHPWNDYQKGLRRHIQADLNGVWNGTQKDIYGAFVPVGQGEMHKLMNWTSRDVVPDTSFFAWFSKKTVSTPIHANWPADTVAVQLAGRKQWVIVEAMDMKKTLLEQKSSLHASGKGGVFYPNLYVDANLEARLKIATQEQGDLLYFPPYCSHTVVSDPGLNVMTALRLHNVKKAFKIHPWKTIQAASLATLNKVVQSTRFRLGLNKYANHYDISKGDLITTAVQLKAMSPVFDDVQLERLLEKDPCPLNDTCEK